MEASVAAVGQGEALDGPPDPQPQQQGQPQAQPDQHADVSALVETLGQQGQTLEEMRSFLESAPWQQGAPEPSQPQPAQEEGPDLTFLNPESPQFDPQQAAQALSQVIDQTAQARADAAMREHIGPLSERVEDMRRGEEANRLAAEFPQLEDPAIAQQVVEFSHQMAESYGQPQLAHEPWFWRMVFMAGRGAELANQERDEVAPNAATLEGSAGASPGGAPEGVSAEALLGLGQRRGRAVLPFG